MYQGSEEDEGSDPGDLSGDDEDDEGARSEDEDDEAGEKRVKIKHYNAEIKVLESTIEKKRNAFSGGNPIMVVSFCRLYWINNNCC